MCFFSAFQTTALGNILNRLVEGKKEMYNAWGIIPSYISFFLFKWLAHRLHYLIWIKVKITYNYYIINIDILG